MEVNEEVLAGLVDFMRHGKSDLVTSAIQVAVTEQRYLVLSIASVLFDECAIIARCVHVEAARQEARTFLEATPEYRGEVAIAQIIEVARRDAGPGLEPG